MVHGQMRTFHPLLGQVSWSQSSGRMTRHWQPLRVTLAKIGSRPILGLSVVNVTQVGVGHGADVGFGGRFDLSVANS
jgi:hypothetical protein